MKIRRSDQRGVTELDWLKAKHSFSFGRYFDRDHMGFNSLRVINQDIISKNSGFDFHPHKDMEIITFILKGSLTHRDSLGNEETIKPGEIQTMSAGRGVVHSEHNLQKDNETELLQIWIEPREKSLNPSYDKFIFDQGSKGTTLIASGEKLDEVAFINQDIEIYYLNDEKSITLKEDHNYWLQIISGELKVGQELLSAGDALSTEREQVVLQSTNLKALLFRL